LTIITEAPSLPHNNIKNINNIKNNHNLKKLKKQQQHNNNNNNNISSSNNNNSNKNNNNNLNSITKSKIHNTIITHAPFPPPYFLALIDSTIIVIYILLELIRKSMRNIEEQFSVLMLFE